MWKWYQDSFHTCTVLFYSLAHRFANNSTFPSLSLGIRVPEGFRGRMRFMTHLIGFTPLVGPGRPPVGTVVDDRRVAFLSFYSKAFYSLQ